MVDHVPPAWMAALQTLRREIEEESLRDARDRRKVERALMIVRETAVAPSESPDAVPAIVLEEDERGEPERFPFRADLMLGLPEAPDGSYWADLRYKTAANLWYDTTLAPRYVERDIFTSWDDRHRGIVYGPDADRERDRAKRLNDLFERGAHCLSAMPAKMNRGLSNHMWMRYWLQCLFDLGCQPTIAPLNMAFKLIWCREGTGKFADYCREHECLFAVDWESREQEFRRIRNHLRRQEWESLSASERIERAGQPHRDAEIPSSLLIREPTTYCVTLDDVLRQSLYMIDWLCSPDSLTGGGGTRANLTTNERMMVEYTRDTSCINWTAAKWAELLKVEESTIRKTPTWIKVIRPERERSRKELRNRPGSRGRKVVRKRI